MNGRGVEGQWFGGTIACEFIVLPYADLHTRAPEDVKNSSLVVNPMVFPNSPPELRERQRACWVEAPKPHAESHIVHGVMAVVSS